MDLRLHMRVLWRFKEILLGGLVLAFVLAFLSYARVSLQGGVHVGYRQDEKFISYSQMLITQAGFPEGRSVIDTGGATGTTGTTGSVAPSSRNAPSFADPSRFTTLALQYAKLVDTDPLRRIRRQWGPLYGQLIAAAVPATSDANGDVIPVISVAGIANSPAKSERLTTQAVRAFEIWLRDQQNAARVPHSDRVLALTISRATPAKVYAARSSVLPIIVFLAVMVAASALAFVLENIRPRMRAVASESDPAAQASAPPRQSAA